MPGDGASVGKQFSDVETAICVILINQFHLPGDAHELSYEILAETVLGSLLMVFGLVKPSKLYALNIPPGLFGEVLPEVRLCVVEIPQIFSGIYVQQFPIKAAVVLAHEMRGVEMVLEGFDVLIVDVL